jgi:hypothetical protein
VEGHVAKTRGGVARRVDVVVLDAAGGGDLDVFSLDEGGEGAGDAEAAACEGWLGEEDPVDQAGGVVLKEGLGEEGAIDGAALHHAECLAEALEEGLVGAF